MTNNGKNGSQKETIPFCKRGWKTMAVIMALVGITTIAWAFHILQDYALEKGYLESGNSAFLSSLKAVGVGAQIIPQLNLDRSVVVNIARPANGAVAKTGEQFETIGSGVIVNPNGYIITANNFITNPQDIVVRASTPLGVKTYEAEIVKIAPVHNLALLKLITRDIFPFVTLGDSRNLQVGEGVYAMGDPYALDLVINRGVISSRGMSVTIGGNVFSNLFQTDAINSWFFTGGPLINEHGHMVGMNFSVFDVNNITTGYTVPAHIIASHFQDVVQFLTSISQKPAGAVPAPSVPTTQFNPPVMNMGRVENELGRNAAMRSPLPGAMSIPMVGSVQQRDEGENQWWREARNYINRQSGADSLMMNPLGLNAALTNGQSPMVDTAHAPGWTLWGYSLENITLLFLLGLVSGISGGMMTMGGGIIQVTCLMLFFGYGILLVRPVAYITNIFVYGASSIRYDSHGFITWGTVRPLIPWAMGGVALGYVIGNYMDVGTIHYLLGILAFVIAIKTLGEIFESSGEDELADDLLSAGISDEKVGEKRRTPFGKILNKFGVSSKGYPGADFFQNGLLGLPMGMISGILGISGGVVGVPLQRYVAKVPLKNAIANSSILVLCASLVGSIIAMFHGVSIGAFGWSTPLALALILIPGAYLGGMVGAWLMRVSPIRVIQWVYVVLMFVIAFKLFIL